MEEREWWYRLSFEGPPEPPRPDERLLLVFHGLDTFATVWLNGEELGRHRNMFREAVFDVGGRVRFGEENTLAILFDRPLDHVGEEALVAAQQPGAVLRLGAQELLSSCPVPRGGVLRGRLPRHGRLTVSGLKQR